MKKVLSVFLAILMLCGALSVGSFAEGTTTVDPSTAPSYYDWWGEGGPCNSKQAVLSFKLNGGVLKNDVQVYDFNTGSFVWMSGKDVTGTYYMVPQNSDLQNAGDYVTLPTVTPPSGLQFVGWDVISCIADQSLVGNTFGGSGRFVIPTNAGKTLIQFVARYVAAEQEEDPMTKVMNILFKVFGAIIGILVYKGDTAAGVELMKKIFGGLF